VKRFHRIALMTSAVVWGLLALMLPISYRLDIWKHYVAITSRFHIGFFQGGVWFYSHDKPYMGSIMNIGAPPTHEVSRVWRTSHGDYGVALSTFIGEQGEIVDKMTACTLPGIYFRHFQVHGEVLPLWTLMVSLWYPLLLSAILPSFWIFRHGPLWFRKVMNTMLDEIAGPNAPVASRLPSPGSVIQYIFAHNWPFKAYLSVAAIVGVVVAVTVCQPSIAIFSDRSYLLVFVVSLLLAPVLFVFLALPFFWILVGPLYYIRARLNGAPFRVGDSIRILVGPYRGRVVQIYDVWDSRHQVRVDLDAETKIDVTDVFSFTQICRESVCKVPAKR
jgi:hypothetical protein